MKEQIRINLKIENLKEGITSVPVDVEPPVNDWVVVFPKDKYFESAANNLMNLIEGAIDTISIDLSDGGDQNKIYGVLIDYDKKFEED